MACTSAAKADLSLVFYVVPEGTTHKEQDGEQSIMQEDKVVRALWVAVSTATKQAGENLGFSP